MRGLHRPSNHEPSRRGDSDWRILVDIDRDQTFSVHTVVLHDTLKQNIFGKSVVARWLAERASLVVHAQFSAYCGRGGKSEHAPETWMIASGIYVKARTIVGWPEQDESVVPVGIYTNYANVAHPSLNIEVVSSEGSQSFGQGTCINARIPNMTVMLFAVALVPTTPRSTFVNERDVKLAGATPEHSQEISKMQIVVAESFGLKRDTVSIAVVGT
jgi:hypothetical protein